METKNERENKAKKSIHEFIEDVNNQTKSKLRELVGKLDIQQLEKIAVDYMLDVITSVDEDVLRSDIIVEHRLVAQKDILVRFDAPDEDYYVFIKDSNSDYEVTQDDLKEFDALMKTTDATSGLYVTKGTFTQEAKEFAATYQGAMLLRDIDYLCDEMFNSRMGVRAYPILLINKEYFNNIIG